MYETLQQMKNRRAAGEDEMLIYVVKYGGNSLIKLVGKPYN